MTAVETRRLATRMLVAAAALCAVWSAWAMVNVVLAGLDARAGRDAAEQARKDAFGSLTSPDSIADLQRAQAHFVSAHHRLSSVATLPARLLPVLGRQVQSVDAVSVGAARVAGVGADALTEVQAALVPEHGSGPARVRLLRRMAEIAASADHDLGDVRLGPGHLLGPVDQVHARLAKEVKGLRDGLRRGAAGATAAADLLAGPRRYLILAANNAEMRSGEGMFLSAGLLETKDGVLTVSPFRQTADLRLPPDAVPLEGDLADRWGWLGPNQEWRNLGVSPRFDVTAPLAARMWEAGGGGPVDGALMVDVATLRALLKAVGPVTTEGRTVDADTVEERVLHGQYVEHAADPDQGARREELGSIAAAVVGALQDRGWDASVLGQALGDAARGRHLLAWSTHPVEQQGWVAAGIDGSLRADSLLVGVLNRGAIKLDRFLGVSASLEIRSDHGRTEGELRLRLRNDVPLGEPMYVAGPDPDSGAGEGVYVGIVAVTLPGYARNARIDDVASLAVVGRDGPTRVVGSAVSIPRGAERSLVVRFEVPNGTRELRVEPSARLPPIAWSSSGLHWRDDKSRTVSW